MPVIASDGFAPVTFTLFSRAWRALRCVRPMDDSRDKSG